MFVYALQRRADDIVDKNRKNKNIQTLFGPNKHRQNIENILHAQTSHIRYIRHVFQTRNKKICREKWKSTGIKTN